MAQMVFRAAANPAPPERLDQMVQPVAAHEWLALFALGLIAAAGLGWGFWGTAGIRASGQAIVVRTGGVQNVLSPAAGVVTALRLRHGEVAKPGQVVAEVAQPLMRERIRNIRDALELARKQRDYLVGARRQETALELESIEKLRGSLRKEIENATLQAQLAREQVDAQEKLYKEGIVVRQQVLAAQQKVAEEENRIAKASAELGQLDPRQYASQNAPESARLAEEIKVSALEQQLNALLEEFRLATQVKTPYGGQVLEVRSYEGASVTIGSPILALESRAETLEALAYLPAEVAKEVTPGMAAELSPANIKRAEYGYIRAGVSGVSEFPVSRAALMRNFENESLVDSLLSRGPVTEVRIALERDDSTPSGFRWSSSSGPPLKLTGGTLGSVMIVTREVRPVTLILPFLREKLGISR